ncbi:MAG: pilin [Patescibacteria group bacterium]
MKKILSLLVLTVLVVSLVAPVAVLAQGTDKIKECCKISQAIDVKDGNECTIVPNKTTLSTPNTTAAADCGWTTADAGKFNVCGNENWGMYCLLNVVYIVTNWIFYLMMIAVVIVFVIAGAKYMMSSGDPEKTKSAKNLMIFGIVGLIVALIAKLVPSVVKLIVAM